MSYLKEVNAQTYPNLTQGRWHIENNTKACTQIIMGILLKQIIAEIMREIS